MNKKMLMNAIGGISDSHIVEFSNVKPSKKSATLWVKIISVAACLALIMIAIPLINNLINTPGSSVSAIPYVKINDKLYIIDSDYSGTAATALPDEYVLIGEIERNPGGKSQDIINGDAAGCKVGEKVFQSPNSPDEIYVYTALFSGNGEYRYVRFVHKS